MNNYNKNSETESISLEIQERIDRESREIALKKTYKRHQKMDQQGELDLQDTSTKNKNEIKEYFPFLNLKHPQTGIVISGVYGIYNKLNGKIYIGSSTDIKIRIQKHLYDLSNNKHHSIKLQNSYNLHGRSSFSCGVLEIISDAKSLRSREQFWIDHLQSYSNGYNSKSRADGPEPSLDTHIYIAKNSELPNIYERIKPIESDFFANNEDHKEYKKELKLAILNKSMLLIFCVMILIFSYLIPLFSILYVIMIFLIFSIIFDWPDTPKKKAKQRYCHAQLIAKNKADEMMIKTLSARLGLPEEKIMKSYPLSEKVFEERKRKRDFYIRKNGRWKYNNW